MRKQIAGVALCIAMLMGTTGAIAEEANLPAVKLIASFEQKSPFEGGQVVAEHATDGAKSLRIDKGYVAMVGSQDWSGYDYLKIDLYTDSADPAPLGVEIKDAATRDYWTRVNYSTIVPPGQSTLVVPIKQLYVGEKSRPGRMLMLGQIRQFVLALAGKTASPLFVDNIRLERDESARQAAFAGLHAFDFGTAASPVMDGFTQITPGTLYSKGRGYGLLNARIWRAFDALQPDPLYQDFICIESGGLAVDVPNGRYRVVVNIDSPSGYWGEYQTYRKRSILAQGKPVVTETMDFETFRRKYFRFWNCEDLPAENTFDKYQKPYFQEKTFDVDVSDGRLNIGFEGENWACCVSAVIIFPVERAEQGARFLKYVQEKRRFYFDNYFKRVLHRPTGDALAAGEEETRRGFVVFTRDAMQELYYNDRPAKEEMGVPLRAEAFAGEYAVVTPCVIPLRDLGKVTLTASDLTGPGGKIAAGAIDMGYVSYRLSRVTMEGTVYTIAPRLIMPGNAVEMPRDVSRRFWLTIRTPGDAKDGVYRGTVTIRAERGGAAEMPVEFRVHRGALDPVDIPAGPFGHSIGIPWPNDPAAAAFNADMTRKSLRKLREYGFTSCSGLPSIGYKGFRNGSAVLDFSQADEQMRLARELGFLAVASYGAGVHGFEAYQLDQAAMHAAGFSDYSRFIAAVYGQVQKHAAEQGWLPVYYNLADEPLGQALAGATANAQAYRRAFPKGPPYFTGASSFRGSNGDDPHFALSKAFHVVSWNIHDEDGVKLLHDAGADWGFYNGGNRWTFGVYMYKAARQFGMKFRLSWHWNAAAGDPYYALDCREDDYAWCNCTPDGALIPSIAFEELREGLGDYRRLATLERLAKEKVGTAGARQLIAMRLGAFKLGQREHDALLGKGDWKKLRQELDEAIDAMR